VQRLFPDVEDGVSPPEAIDIGVPIEDVEKVMKKMERGTAPGPSGLRVDHLKQVMEITSGQHKDELLGLLAQVIAQAAGGHWETALARWITGGKITPLRKKDGGVRPVVAVETLRSLVSRFVLQSCAGMARDYLPAKQKGFTPGANGMQTAVYTVREWAKRSHEKVILKLDITNAFNTISRRACCEEADNIDIVLGCWARWSLAANPFRPATGTRSMPRRAWCKANLFRLYFSAPESSRSLRNSPPPFLPWKICGFSTMEVWKDDLPRLDKGISFFRTASPRSASPSILRKAKSTMTARKHCHPS
jgi:hypothetical protein